MEPDTLKDRFRGCLIGGAAGDALGYPVEFLSLGSILRNFGESGITSFSLFPGYERALVSDDTQMTLFTANGLLCCAAKAEAKKPAVERDCIREAYLDWLFTQKHPLARRPFKGDLGRNPVFDPKNFHSWLMSVPWLLGKREPGRTCISALEAGGNGSFEETPNFSRGCGGVMRTAPAGLYAKTDEEALRIGAEAAVLTHGNPLGFIPAGVCSYIVYRAAHTDEPLTDVVRASLDASRRFFTWSQEVIDACNQFVVLTEKALELAKAPANEKDTELIANIGEGWNGDEALAIAVLCAVRYEHDFEKCLIAAVNHSGDSDSTGAIAGNLLGARFGLSHIPAKFTELLEGIPEMTTIADDLFNKDHPDDEWRKRYLF